MAKTESTSSIERTPKNEPGLLDAERKKLALEAVWEIEVLTNLLLEKSASEEWELENEPALILRGLGVRIVALSRVVMSALDDPIQKTSHLRKTVFGHA